MKKPRILVIDIETSPLETQVFGIWDQNIGLGQIIKDWTIISYSAKFVGEKGIIQEDTRHEKDVRNDKKLVKNIRDLLDSADIVLGQNSKKFDVKKINARIEIHKIKPPSSFRQIDTCQLAKKHFGFTSNKLEYLSDKLNTKYKKLKHKKYPGHELWRECLAGNQDAWKDMAKYNNYDILATEELYVGSFMKWDNSVNFNLYHDEETTICTCGSTDFVKNGHVYLSTGKYQRYSCKACGSELRDRTNLLTKDKRNSLKRSINR